MGDSYRYYLKSGTLSCWDLPVQTPYPLPPSAQSPPSSLCQYFHDTRPSVAATEQLKDWLLQAV